MGNVFISVYATGAPQDTGVSVERWNEMDQWEQVAVAERIMGEQVDWSAEDEDGQAVEAL